MKKLNRCQIVASFKFLLCYHLISIVSGEQTLEEKAEMFSQLGKLPLAKNPFFIKSIANSGQFDGEGTEGMTPDFTGYSCRWVGDLDCQVSNFKFQCDGSGIIDCTGSCPGDEEAVSKMMTMMEDKKLQDEFPMLAQMKAEQAKDPEKAKAGKERFVKILKGCGFNGLVALAGLSDGIDFGAAKDNDNSSVTHVDEGALSGFSYDYEEEESNDKKNETMMAGEDDKKSDMMDDDKKEKPVDAVPEPEPVTEKKMTSEKEQMKKGEESSSRSLENETFRSKQSDIEMADDPKNNTIDLDTREKDLRQVPKRESIDENNSRSMPLNKDATKTEKSEEQTLAQLHSEVNGLQQVFLGAIEEAEGKGSRRRKRSTIQTELILSLASDIKRIHPSLRRRIRSVVENMTANAKVEDEKCKVQNLSCVTFPTTAQCSGIAMGGCMSHRKILATIFTSRVIMMVVCGIIVIVLAGVGIAVYINKRKTSQSVEPVEPEDPNAPKGAARAK